MDEFANQAIANMRSPKDMSIICVDVTNKCDLHCSNCTRLLKNQKELWDMTPENFRVALRSLREFSGVIAMIGGNPCMHKRFPELCKVFAEEVPNKRQRGLWSNNIFDNQDLVHDTFGFFNLNPHNDPRGVKSLNKLKALLPQLNIFKGHSHHAPILTAVKDLYPNPQEMWKVVQGCDINREWSATIIQNKGELRAYFCEVAAAFDLARGEDHGAPVTDGWWQKSIQDYSDQVKHFCPGCGVPARLKGHLDIEERDTYSPFNETIAKRQHKRGRATVEVRSLEDASRSISSFVHYNLHFAYVDNDTTPGEGVIGLIAYSKNNHYFCIPNKGTENPNQAMERIYDASSLPKFITNLIVAEDNVLYVGTGFALDIFDIAAKARKVTVLEPNHTAVETLKLNCRLNQCSNVQIERLAAYDQNGLAEFAVATDTFNGLMLATDGTETDNLHVKVRAHGVRIDDYFSDTQFDVVTMTLAGYGDLFVLSGAQKQLAKTRTLVMEFNHAYYAAKSEHLGGIAAELEKSFTHCYAPQSQIKNAAAGFTDLFAYLVANQKNDCLILTKTELV